MISTLAVGDFGGVTVSTRRYRRDARTIEVRTHRGDEPLDREDQLAWRIADVAAASLGRGASVFGIASRHSPEWALYANGVAVPELDSHDTLLAVVPAMQTRARLYEVVDYTGYAVFDAGVASFDLSGDRDV